MQLALIPVSLLSVLGGILLLAAPFGSPRMWFVALAGAALVLVDFVIFLPWLVFPSWGVITSVPAASLFYVGFVLLLLTIILGVLAALGMRTGVRNRPSPVPPSTPAS